MVRISFVRAIHEAQKEIHRGGLKALCSCTHYAFTSNAQPKEMGRSRANQ